MKSTNSNNATASLLCQELDDYRQQGNHQFRQGNYETAVQLYSMAILRLEGDDEELANHQEELTMNEDAPRTTHTTTAAATESVQDHQQQQSPLLSLPPELSSLLIVTYCNRSACYYKMGDYDAAKADAMMALRLDPDNLKASFRLASTLVALLDYDAAKQVIQSALELIKKSQRQQPEKKATAATTKVTEPVESQQNESTADSVPDNSNQPHEEQPLQPQQAAAPSLDEQRKAFENLWNHCLQAALVRPSPENATTKNKHNVPYASLSIKDFFRDPNISLGSGNFTEVYHVTHNASQKQFALKVINKKQAADLAKRQHPNVWNEIQMERRILLERLVDDSNSDPDRKDDKFCSASKFIIRLFATFQDYNNLYYLMELHDQWGDLWSELRLESWHGRHRFQSQESPSRKMHTADLVLTDVPAPRDITKYMVGAHPSQTKVWMYELVSALEFIHSRGVVHRDLKPENILLNQHGHVVVIDFGTAKDLIVTDLNGPEFVGTPDFMSPEAVEGKGDQDGDDKKKDGADKEHGAVQTSDLWALGAILYILHCGQTPFWCPSPYLAFLKIKRCNLVRAPGIIDDDCWDLITKLMQRDPTKRLGADAFTLHTTDSKRTMEVQPGGYDEIRNRPYFQSVRDNPQILKKTPVPSLRDLCIRALAELAHTDSLDIELCDKHPPGDGSCHDMMRLKSDDRAAVMHVLERMKLLREPRLYARFFVDQFACRLDKIRPESRDFVGLTQMTDDQGKAPRAMVNDPYGKPVDFGATRMVHLTNPLFVQRLNESCTDEQRKEWTKLLKKAISIINRKRPKLCVAAGYIDAKCRKLLSRISETIPVVCHDGSAFFSFWILGIQCIAIQATDHAVKKGSLQTKYLGEQLEQCRMSKQPLFAFIDTDPRRLPQVMQKRLARGRVLAVYGVSENDTFKTVEHYTANLIVDEESVKSTSSEEDAKDHFSMLVYGTCRNCLRWITVGDEPGDWDEELDEIDADGNEVHLDSSRRLQEPLEF